MPEELIAGRSFFDRSRSRAVVGGEWFFFAALIFLFITAATWGGLFLLKRSFSVDAENWKQQVTKLEQELRPDLLNELVALSGRLSALQEIVSGHRFSSNVFSLVEQRIHPGVTFTSFSYSDEARKIELTGKGASYRVVAEQIALFEADPQAESVSFGGLSLDSNGSISFKSTIIFKPGLLRLRTGP